MTKPSRILALEGAAKMFRSLEACPCSCNVITFTCEEVAGAINEKLFLEDNFAFAFVKCFEVCYAKLFI